ncbi:hypothetical protein [Paludisphaera mucosa]|uniref:Uncharacterized protein n=1 Tax=Paludisphaera mucosa TaxID=3030827 RepID=A0ABT6FG80_9BACT|nr:hypothetical protein [Paludisphaera mucosa]MDG3006514.1 hypothetical protein [Paludisphaera mucosa]
MDTSDGRGGNVEIAATSNCDAEGFDLNWTMGCEWYGEPHLIRGLHEMKAIYERPIWRRLSEFAEYSLFLGYSGIVLAEAFEGMGLESEIRMAWGFHDGDLFLLGRSGATGFRRLVIESEPRPEGPFLRIWDGG